MEPLTHLMAGALVGHAFAGFHPEPTVSLTAMAMAMAIRNCLANIVLFASH